MRRIFFFHSKRHLFLGAITLFFSIRTLATNDRPSTSPLEHFDGQPWEMVCLTQSEKQWIEADLKAKKRHLWHLPATLAPKIDLTPAFQGLYACCLKVKKAIPWRRIGQNSYGAAAFVYNRVLHYLNPKTPEEIFLSLWTDEKQTDAAVLLQLLKTSAIELNAREQIQRLCSLTNKHNQNLLHLAAQFGAKPLLVFVMSHCEVDAHHFVARDIYGLTPVLTALDRASEAISQNKSQRQDQVLEKAHIFLRCAFVLLGQPQKPPEKIKKILETFSGNSPDALAWHITSAINRKNEAETLDLFVVKGMQFFHYSNPLTTQRCPLGFRDFSTFKRENFTHFLSLTLSHLPDGEKLDWSEISIFDKIYVNSFLQRKNPNDFRRILNQLIQSQLEPPHLIANQSHHDFINKNLYTIENFNTQENIEFAQKRDGKSPAPAILQNSPLQSIHRVRTPAHSPMQALENFESHLLTYDYPTLLNSAYDLQKIQAYQLLKADLEQLLADTPPQLFRKSRAMMQACDFSDPKSIQKLINNLLLAFHPDKISVTYPLLTGQIDPMDAKNETRESALLLSISKKLTSISGALINK